jgi:hypothetical protein
LIINLLLAFGSATWAGLSNAHSENNQRPR